MAASIHLLDHFLIAMPAMEDPYFAKSLVYIAEHNDQGALGIIVNRPIDMSLAALFERIDLSLTSDTLARLPVFFGGPVQKADMGVGALDDFAVQFQDKAQHAVGRRMLRAEVEGEIADISHGWRPRRYLRARCAA